MATTFNIVDLHFAANGTTSEIDEYISREFEGDSVKASECFEYAVSHKECTGAIWSVFDENWDVVGIPRAYGSYSDARYDD